MPKTKENYELVAYSLLLVTPDVLQKYVYSRYPSDIRNFKEPFKEKLSPEHWNQVEELIGRWALHLFYNHVHNTVLDKNVLDYLIGKDVMSIEDGKEVRGQTRQSAKNKIFLDILIKKPGDNYYDFMDALRNSEENRKFVNTGKPPEAERRTEIQIKVQKNFVKLVSEIDCTVILDELYTKAVLKDDEMEEIKCRNVKSDINRYVLGIVLKNAEFCEVFLNALGDDPVYKELVDTINATEVTEAEIQKNIQVSQTQGSMIDVSTMINLVSVLFKTELPTETPLSGDISFGADLYRLQSYITDITNTDDIDDEMMKTIFSEITKILERLDGPEIKDVLWKNFENRKKELINALTKLKGREKLEKDISDILSKDLFDVKVIEGCDADFEIWTKENIVCTKWFKYGSELSNSDKFQIHCSNYGKIHSLKICNTDLSDKGVYTVRVLDVERRARLEIIEYFTKATYMNMECTEGENVDLSFEVLDVDVSVVWKKDGYVITNSKKYEINDHGKTHKLSIINTELTDAGNYLVQVNNRTRITSVTIKEYFSTNLENKECLVGDDIFFECEILDEDVIARWFKDDDELHSSTKYKVQRQARRHQLCIIKASPNDAGKYCALIKNCQRTCSLTVRENPKKTLSEKDKNSYLNVIESTTETRFYIRIIIIGENGVGKTCLIHRLLKLDINDVKSTDGIDIYRCKIRNEDGTWVHDKETDKRKQLIARMKRSIQTPTHDYSERNGGQESNNKTQSMDSSNSSTSLQMVSPYSSTNSQMESSNSSTNLQMESSKNSHQARAESMNEEIRQLMSKHKTRDTPTMEEEKINSEQAVSQKLDSILNDRIVQELTEILDDIENSEVADEVLVDCGFWDFAGQREYYPTHPIFLNPHALHLLVANITKDIETIKAEKGFDQIGEYLEFWFDSVHSLRYIETEEDQEDHTNEKLNPPVILVCTNIDKCKDVNKLEKRTETFRNQVLKMLGEEKRKHLRHMCRVSNTDSTEEEFDNLRKLIFKFGKEMKTFGEKLPLKFIRLERALDIVRETGVNILSSGDIKTIAYKCSFCNEFEITEFLKYQHKIGNIIYFEKLHKTIILNQKWLADAFRCLVSVRFDEAVKLTPAWKRLEETGMLSENLIEKLLQKESKLDLNKNRQHILEVMEMFGIIFKITTRRPNGGKPASPTYYMPSMISSQFSIEDIRKEFCASDECTQSPWLCIEFTFMPLDVFNNIMREFISRYSVCNVSKTNQKAIYHGLGVFDLDEFYKLAVYFSKNTIALQVWKWEPIEQSKYKEIVESLRSWISIYQIKYETRRLTYTVKTKCSDGDIHNPLGRKSYKDLSGIEKFNCEDHRKNHWSKDFLETWFHNYSETPLYAGVQQPDQDVISPEIYDAKEFKAVLKQGTYASFGNRIYLAGACSVGKSTLACLLIGDETPLEWKSTDGLKVFFGRYGIHLEERKMVQFYKEKQAVITDKIQKEDNEKPMEKMFGISSIKIKHEIKKRENRVNKIVPSDLVVFGGYKSYDMTHQLFIQGKATFTLLFDGRKGLHDPLPEYPQGNVTAASILKHWVDSILTFWEEDDDDILPLILFVATHRDTLNEDKQKTIMIEFQQGLKEMFQNHELANHIKYNDIYFINGTDRNDAEVNRLQTTYVDIAFRQRSWGKRMQMAFVPLKLQLSEMRSSNINIISKDDLIKINEENEDLALTKKALDDFLQAQHVLGKIMYFQRQGLENFIIVQPTALVDILRSFITDEMFFPADTTLRQILNEMTKTGKIRKEDMFKLWKQDQFNQLMPSDNIKEFVVKVLIHLDFLVEPKRYNARGNVGDVYLVPCIIKQEPTTQFCESLDEKKTLHLSYKLLKSSIPSALSFKIIGSVLNVWPLKETEAGGVCLYNKAAILRIDQSNELYILVRDNRVVVCLQNMLSKQFISPDIASCIQECLTLTIENALKFYHSSFGKLVTTLEITKLFKVEVGEKCKTGICYLPLLEAKHLTSWKCTDGEEHKTQYPLYWSFDKGQHCKPDCPGFDQEFFRYRPKDKHLARLAQLISPSNFSDFVLKLELPKIKWDDVEYKHRGGNISLMKIEALCTWNNFACEPSFQHLHDAITGSGYNCHLLCQIFREDTTIYNIDHPLLQTVPDDDMLQELSKNIGNCVVHLGIELDVPCTEIEETTTRYSKEMFNQNKDILMKWRNKYEKTNRTLRTLMHVLNVVDKRGCTFLEKRYGIKITN